MKIKSANCSKIRRKKGTELADSNNRLRNRKPLTNKRPVGGSYVLKVP